MRISDWSSDVCSSDLRFHLVGLDVDQIGGVFGGEAFHRGQQQRLPGSRRHPCQPRARHGLGGVTLAGRVGGAVIEIGRAPDRLEGTIEPEPRIDLRSEEQPSELPSLMRISYARY